MLERHAQSNCMRPLKFRSFGAEPLLTLSGPTLQKKGGERGAYQLPKAPLQLVTRSLIMAVNSSLI